MKQFLFKMNKYCGIGGYPKLVLVNAADLNTAKQNFLTWLRDYEVYAGTEEDELIFSYYDIQELPTAEGVHLL